MQVGASKGHKHTSKVAKEWLTQAIIYVLEWTSQGPDFNPIENICALLKKQVRVRKPTNSADLHHIRQKFNQKLAKTLWMATINA